MLPTFWIKQDKNGAVSNLKRILR